MPTLITHALVGAAAAATVAGGNASTRFWVLSVACSVLPDADIVGFALGVAYHHMFGHRGFFHSFGFAILLALTIVLVFFPQEPVLSKRWAILTAYFFLIAASHGVLDALTNGGLGIALLAFRQLQVFLSSCSYRSSSHWDTCLLQSMGSESHEE